MHNKFKRGLTDRKHLKTYAKLLKWATNKIKNTKKTWKNINGLFNRNRVTNISLLLEFGERVKGDVVAVYVNFDSNDSVKDSTKVFVSGYNADILKGISNVKILAFLIQHAKMK